MRKYCYRLVSAGVVAVLLVGAPVSAQENTNPDIEEKAMAVLMRMAAVLAQTPSYSVGLEIGFDVVQDSGQKVEFGETRQLVLKRPNHLRVDSTKRDGSQTRFSFDGQHISVFNAKENVYATVAKPGTLDEAVDYFLNDLDMRLPLAQMFSTQLPAVLQEQVWAASYVEQASIAGVACDHLAVRGSLVDLQVWVAQGEQALPQRLVMTYRRTAGQPQFWTQFSDWNLSPDATDAQFAFSPPEGAAQINIVPGNRQQAVAAETQGGQ